MLKKQVRIKHPHSKNCFIVGTDREYYCPVGFFFGNFAGNKTKYGAHHYWIEMQCNNTDCEYRSVIDVQLIGQQFLTL